MTIAEDGKRYKTAYRNPDAIISVRYRMKSPLVKVAQINESVSGDLEVS